MAQSGKLASTDPCLHYNAFINFISRRLVDSGHVSAFFDYAKLQACLQNLCSTSNTAGRLQFCSSHTCAFSTLSNFDIVPKLPLQMADPTAEQ